MGMCKPSGGKIDMVGRIGSLPRIGIPNTRIDLYDEFGRLLQQGWYGPDGRIIWSRDHIHGEKGGIHEWPHDHYFNWVNKKKSRPPYIGPNGERINLNFC